MDELEFDIQRIKTIEDQINNLIAVRSKLLKECNLCYACVKVRAVVDCGGMCKECCYERWRSEAYS